MGIYAYNEIRILKNEMIYVKVIKCKHKFFSRTVKFFYVSKRFCLFLLLTIMKPTNTNTNAKISVSTAPYLQL